MLKSMAVALIALSFALPALGKNHPDIYPVSCSELWSAVKDTLRNSGRYGIISINNTEMTASFSFRGAGSTDYLAASANSVVLNPQGTSCEMRIQSAASRSARDFKKRVDESLAKLSAPEPAEAAKPEGAPK